MNELYRIIQIAFVTLGGWLGWFLGCDELIPVLIIFVVSDYITGVMCATQSKSLNSEVGFKGIFKKICIFILVGITNIIDVYILHHVGVLRTATIFFYISNEGLSILENLCKLGVSFPRQVVDVLEQLKEQEKGGKDE